MYKIDEIYVLFTEEFVAHMPNVNCLALGHKSGRVLATGGDDKKVNLWAVGKQNCIMVIILQQFFSLINSVINRYKRWCNIIDLLFMHF